jgi:hypothetical protein
MGIMTHIIFPHIHLCEKRVHIDSSPSPSNIYGTKKTYMVTYIYIYIYIVYYDLTPLTLRLALHYKCTLYQPLLSFWYSLFLLYHTFADHDILSFLFLLLISLNSTYLQLPLYVLLSYWFILYHAIPFWKRTNGLHLRR